MTVREDTEAAVRRRYVTTSEEGERHRQRLLDAFDPILTELERIRVEMAQLDDRITDLEPPPP